MSDSINPDHYKRLPAEAIEIIESAIDNAPSNQDAYLQGQVLKYVLRCWNKNGIEDLKKAKWYLDRLVDSLDEYEQQKASDLQSLKDHPFGKLKEPAWTPKVGDWVRIKKPADTQASATCWWPSMDKYDGQIIQVKQIEEDGVVLEEWGFMFDWLEPAEQPAIKQSLTTEPPDGWRWLELGEVIRKGDRGFEKGLLYAIEPMKIGMTLQAHWMPTIRRNRFEVGEKVVRVSNGVVYKVICILSMGYQLESEFCAEVILHAKDLAPYIEETK